MLDEQALADGVNERLAAFIYLVVISLLTGSLAWRNGFLKKPALPPPFVFPKGTDVLKAFIAFILAQAIVVPALVVVFSYMAGTEFNLLNINKTAHGWISLLSVLGGFLGVFFVFLGLSPDRRKAVWGNSSGFLFNLGLGILTWFVAYPIVTAIAELISAIVLFVFQQPQVDQVAVAHLKKVAENPWLFASTVISVACLVPCAEELLFRGFLQSWLRAKLKRPTAAIVATSAIFALFHYSVSQGVTNIELLSSLFLLSCFLGYLYERQRSLWAPIGLHGFFNAMSVLMIVGQTL